MNKAYVVVDTHSNPELHRIAQELIEKNTPARDLNGNIAKNLYRYLHYSEGNGILMHSQNDTGVSYKRTDFIDMEVDPVSKLLKALAKKTIAIKINDTYKAEVARDKSGVQVGCTFVSKDIVTQIYNALK